MNLFVLSFIPQYIVSPFWFVIAFLILYLLAHYMYKKELDAVGKDEKKHDAKAGGWAVLEFFFLFFGIVAVLWLVVAVIIYFISSA